MEEKMTDIEIELEASSHDEWLTLVKKFCEEARDLLEKCPSLKPRRKELGEILGSRLRSILGFAMIPKPQESEYVKAARDSYLELDCIGTFRIRRHDLQVKEIYEIGDYQILVNEKDEFLTYEQGKRTGYSYSTLDQALLGLLVGKYDGDDGAAFYYVARMIGMPLEKEEE